MHQRTVLLIPVFFLLLCSLYSQSWQSTQVYFNDSGKLIYAKDATKNRIPDFSFAGYKKGEAQIPAVPTVITITPIPGDNTSRIQTAINQAGALTANAQGIRGAVLLSAGIYRISGTIKINFDGVVLRGVGNGTDSLSNTILYGTGNTPHQRSIILAGGGSNTKWKEQVSSTKTNITRDTVYIGDTTITVASAANLNVGDNIVIYHPSTETWLQAIEYGGTHSNDPGAEPGIDVPWVAGDADIIYNRHIKAKNGNTLTLDIPVYHHLIKSLSQSYVYKYARTGLKTNIGIENLRVDNDFSGEFDEDHVWQSIDLFQLEDSWVKDCAMIHFGQSGIRTCTATRVTIKNCTSIDPVSIITGERRYNYQFYHASQMILIDSCHAANGRHHYMSNGTSSTSGNVFHNCTSMGAYASSEGHRLWTQGLLYDNHRELDGPRVDYSDILLALYCRGYAGTSHGWSSVNSVAWNCDVANGSLVLQRPPLSQNYAIGCKGLHITGHPPVAQFDEPEGFIEGSNLTGLIPQSLYSAQLMQRLGGYAEPTVGPSEGGYELYDSTSVKLHWTNGNGLGRIVIGRQAAAASAVPVDNTSYTANTSFGAGSPVGTDSYVVFMGQSDSVIVGGLQAGKTYTFSVFEWNGSPGFENYYSSSPLTIVANVPALAYYSNGTGGGSWDSASSWAGGFVPDSASIVVVRSGDSLRVLNSGTKVGTIKIAAGGKLVASGSNIGAANTKFFNVYGSSVSNDGVLGTGSDGLSIRVMDSLVISGSSTAKLTKIIPGSSEAKVVINSNCELNYRAGAISSGGALLLVDGGTAPNPNTKFSLVEVGSGKTVTFPNYSKLQQSSSQDQDWNFSTTLNIKGSVLMGDSATALTLRPNTGSMVNLNIYGTVVCRQLNISALAGSNSAQIHIAVGGLLKVGQGISGTMDCSNPGIIVDGAGTFQTVSGTTITVGSPNGLDTALGLIRTKGRIFSTGTNFVFNGTTRQTAGDMPDTVNNFTINNTSGVSLNKRLQVNGNIVLTAGKLFLGSQCTLTLMPASFISGSLSVNNMLVPESGALCIKRFSSAGSFTFPFGDTAVSAVYLPVTLTLAQGTYANGSVSLFMQRNKHPYNSSANNYLKRFWGFYTTGITGYTASLTMRYSDTDIQGQESQLSPWICNGSLWQQSGTITASSNQIMCMGLTSGREVTAGEQSAIGGTAVLNLKAVLQGQYDPTANRMRRNDTLTMYLASDVSPFGFIDSCSAILDSSTFTATGTFNRLSNGLYYPVIRHRNSVEIWGAHPFQFAKGAIVQRDFTQFADSVYGANLIDINGLKAVYAGDVNQDGKVDFADITLIDEDASDFLQGYYPTDLNGDRIVDFSDLVMADNNAYNLVGIRKPGFELVKSEERHGK